MPSRTEQITAHHSVRIAGAMDAVTSTLGDPMSAPSVIVFDVNETLSDMSPMARRFADIGAPEHLAKLWFATLLRDGFALTSAGACPSFATLGVDALHIVLDGVALDRTVAAATDYVMTGFSELVVHPDVSPGVRALRRAGRRLFTLSNGSRQVAEGLFARSGILDEFEALLSVDDAGAWKPARTAYDYAARICDTAPGDMLLVAVHPWDIDGAARAGLQTAWINRSRSAYPGSFTPPSFIAAGLTDLAQQLA